MADLIKPELMDDKWMICGRAWASVIMSGFIIRWSWLKKIPFPVGELINIVLGFLIISVIKIQRALHFEIPYISRN
jgi:hypothetical protein